MQSIKALSLTPAVNDWLANSPCPRILHVFDQACNLINEHREVLSIVTSQIGNGPFNLVVEDNVLFSDHLNAQSSISVRANLLNLGDLTIHTGNVELWSPRPDWEALHANKDDILNRLMSLRAIGPGLDTSFAKPAQGYSTTALVSSLLITNYQSLFSALCTSIASADLPSSLAAARGLAGLGPGLTPAGDDFLLGAIYAAWIVHPVDVARVLAEEITNAAAPLTTSLSAAWLKSAGRGEAGILWHNFFDALISANLMRIQVTVKKILIVGDTSGADAFGGFISMLMCWVGSKVS